ncbi:MAG: NHLP bacteriocin export ABC transporter permease/ATPase subunit [Rhodospirillaceae bacterium]
MPDDLSRDLALPGARLTLEDSGTILLTAGANVELFLAGAGGEAPFRHVATLPPGALLFGAAADDGGVRLIADLAGGATVSPVPLEETLAAAVTGWLGALEDGLARDLPPEKGPGRLLTPGAVLDLKPGERVRAESGIAWCCVTSGTATLRGGVAPGEAPVPVSRRVWLEAGSNCQVEAVAQPAVAGPGVTAFTAAALRLLGERRTEEADAEQRRLARRRSGSAATMRRVLSGLVALVDRPPAGADDAVDLELALYEACAVVCARLGVPFKKNHNRRATDPLTLAELAVATGFRRRRIRLRGRWWREDTGPLVGYLDDERLPVALVFDGLRGGYSLILAGEQARPIDEKLAGRLHPTADMCYAPLPGQPIGISDVLALGLRQCGPDIVFIVVASLAVTLIGLAVPVATGLIFNTIVPGHYSDKLLEVGLGLIVLAIMSTVFQITVEIASLRVQGRLSGTILAAVWDRVLRLPHGFFASMSPGDINLRAQSIEGLSRALATIAVSVFNSGIMLIFNLAMMALWIPAAALIALGLTLVLAAATAIAIHFQKKAIFEGEQVAADLSTMVTELVSCVGKLRLAGAESRAYTRWAETFAEMRRRSIAAQQVGINFGIFIAGFEVLTLALMFTAVIYWPNPDLAVGSFLGFIAAFTVYQRCSATMATMALGIANLMPQAARAQPILKAVPQTDEGLADPRQLSGAVEVNNVVFGYGEQQEPVLRGVSLEAEPGQFVAIVGPSGCGKSTLMRLLLGWENPWAGSIFYDRQDLRMLSRRAVRRQIGVVLQNGRLVPGSLYENIVGGDGLSLEDAWEAARIAGLEADIRAMPMGMHTVLTEGTAALSGGQMQRLMIARAVVGKPAILMFDEATSSLDTLSQAVISENLRRIAATRIIIAHRLSTIRDADMIFVLEKGRVVESGTFERLSARGGSFSRLIV